MDYFDILLAKKLSGGGGGGEITVEGLTVNDNGTYTAPSGKAYSPVVVNLPLGEKAITANGEYNASADDLKGYSKVTVAVEGFKIKDMPTGAISSFDDGTENPLKELKVSIVPVQSGSGDPSPTNPRPISGWTGANVYQKGINIWDEVWESGAISNQTGQNTVNPNAIRSTNYIPVREGSVFYVFSSFNARGYDVNKIYIKDIGGVTNQTLTIPPNVAFIRFQTGGTTYNNNISINSPSTDHDYHAYESLKSKITNITWQTEAGTVYGGELDVTSGILKARPYYASYNSEPLVGPWISSLDEYEEGATPTTGAQVVDLGGTETTYQLTPTQITTLLGQNNLWADSGDVISGKYFASL